MYWIAVIAFMFDLFNGDKYGRTTYSKYYLATDL